MTTINSKKSYSVFSLNVFALFADDQMTLHVTSHKSVPCSSCQTLYFMQFMQTGASMHMQIIITQLKENAHIVIHSNSYCIAWYMH